MPEHDTSTKVENISYMDNEVDVSVGSGKSVVSIDCLSQTFVRESEEEPSYIFFLNNGACGRLGYFALYTGLSVSPYYGLFLDNKGFTPFTIGVIVSFMPLGVFFFLPSLLSFADKYNSALKIQLGAALGSSLLFLLTTFFSSRYLICICIILHFILRAPLGSFMDQRTMSALPSENKMEWGSMRSYGAYGWAFGAVCSSVLVGLWGWYALAVLYTVCIFFSTYIAFRIVPHDNPKRSTFNYWELLSYSFLRVRLAVFLFVIFLMGLGYGIISTFLFIFLKSINAPIVLLGLSVVMTVVVEIPLFNYSNYILANITDRQLLCLSMWAWVLRVLSYSFLRNPWLVLFIELLHCFTFALMWLSGMHFVRRAFPSWLSHSSIGFLSATSFGLGPLIGNIVGGALYQILGGRWMFRVMAIFIFVISIIFLILDRYLDYLGYGIEEMIEETVDTFDLMTLQDVVFDADNKKEGE